MYTSLLILLPCKYAVLMSKVLNVQPLLSMVLRTIFKPSDEQVGASFSIPASFSLKPRATNLAFHISSLFLIFLLIIHRVSTMLLLLFISSLLTSSKTPFSFQLSNSFPFASSISFTAVHLLTHFLLPFLLCFPITIFAVQLLLLLLLTHTLYCTLHLIFTIILFSYLFET